MGCFIRKKSNLTLRKGMIVKMKKIKLKHIHIAIIVLGILFISIPAFHTG